MSKIPKPKVLLGTVILVAALVALAVVPVMAQIPVFSAFLGDVLLDGANAPVGATVDVYVGTEATPRATVTLTTAGYYEVNVQGQATDVGQAVSFKVNGYDATPTPASPLFGNYTTQTVDLAASSGPAPDEPDISVSSTSVSLGSVYIGSSSTQTLTISNVGNAALTVTGITITGTAASQFSASPTSGNIAAGSSMDVTVTFSPTSEGAKSAILAIASDDPDEATVNVNLSGTGIVLPVGDYPVLAWWIDTL